MKKLIYQYPKSSFLSLEKDLGIIIDKMLENDRLKKLLKYTTIDCLQKESLSEEESLELISDGNIRLIPKLYVDKDVLNYIIISFDKFIPNATNTEFRDNLIVFDIVCHFDQWLLNDFQLRPYKIAAEIDTLFNNRHLSGIGQLLFLGGEQFNINNEFGGFTMIYAAVHGEDDKINSPNKKDQEDIINNFNNIFNKDE